MPVDQSQLRVALSRGKPLVLGDGMRPDWTPTSGDLPTERVVRADDLRDVVLNSEAAKAADPRGLVLEGALILGALDLDGAVIPYPLGLRRCQLLEPVTLVGTHLKGGLELVGTGVVGKDANGVSILATALQVDIIQDASPISDQRFYTAGSIVVTRARIAELRLDGAEIGADVLGYSIHADELQLDGTLYGDDTVSGYRLETVGSVHLTNAHVASRISLRGAALGAGHDGVSLWAHGLHVGGPLVAGLGDRNQFQTAGSLQLSRARVAGPLVLTGAALGASPGGSSLEAGGIRLEGNLSATTRGGHQFRPAGSISLFNAQVDGYVHFGSQGDAPAPAGGSNGAEYQLQGLQAAGLILDEGPTALVNLTTSRIRTLIIHDRAQLGLPRLESAHLWSVSDALGVVIDDRQAAERWLASAAEPSAQSILELASVYERHGKPADARWLRYRAAVLGTQRRPLGSWLLRTLYRWIVGHGYYPLAALLWLVLVLSLSWGVAAWQSDAFTTTTTATIRTDLEDRLAEQQARPGTVTPPLSEPLPGRAKAAWWTLAWDVPPFSPFFYALSSTLPVATGQTTWAAPDTWVAIVLSLLRLVAWTLTALFLAGVTGLLRKG